MKTRMMILAAALTAVVQTTATAQAQQAPATPVNPLAMPAQTSPAPAQPAPAPVASATNPFAFQSIAQPAPQTNTSPFAAARPAVSDIIVNDVPLTVEKANWLRSNGVNVPAGSYWYDPVSGNVGMKGGPAAGMLAPGLDLGGPLKAGASNGNSGYFVNGRQLTQIEATGLAQTFRIGPGRYAMDSQTNFGYEGQAPAINLRALVMQMVQQVEQQQAQQQVQQPQYNQQQYNQPRRSLSERGMSMTSDVSTFDGEGGVFIGSGSGDSVSYHP